MQPKIEIRNMEQVQAFLKSVPRGTLRAALAAMANYFLGNERRGLRHYPQRVQHSEGNPYQWQTERQRRAYFATNGFGAGIPYKRTGKLAEGWYTQERQAGYAQIIANSTPYADYVQGFLQQRGHWADKWRKARDIILSNMRGAMQAGQKAADAWIKTKSK